MKKIITTLAFALLLCVNAQAQSCDAGQNGSKPSPDAKLISSTTRGNNRVTTWLVKKSSPDANNEFSVKYRVNISRLISTYDTNHTELVKLRAFMDGLMANGENEVVRVAITGYASPDGSKALNEKLANDRAIDCCNYLKKEYSALKNIPCTTEGVAELWSATEQSVESSSIPMKSDVLSLVRSNMTQPQIEAKLRAMPSVWSYMTSSILPPMRCVEIEVIYTTWEKIVTRTPLKKPVVEEVAVVNNYFFMVEQNPSQVMAFENSTAPLDFQYKDKDRFKYRDRRRRAKVKEELRDYTGRHKYLWKSR